MPVMNEYRNSSGDFGKTYQVEKIKVLYAIQFYLSEDIIAQRRTLYSFLDLISDFGGLYQVFIIGFFYMVGESINENVITAKVIRSLFYLQNKITPEQKSHVSDSIK